MPLGTDTSSAATRRERFGEGWTGSLAVILFAYIAIAVVLAGREGPVLKIFNLFSDSPASIVVALLAGMAARAATDPSTRRTWWWLTAALTSYSLGNLLHSTFWLFDVDPFPSIGDVFFLAFYPLIFVAAVTVARAAAVRVPWARLALDATILMLGFGAFFWFCVISPTASAQHGLDVFKYALAQTYIALNCGILLAFGLLLMYADTAPIHRRVLTLLTLGFSSMSVADIVWAMSKVAGTYVPGGVSDLIYLTCYVWLAAAAREQLRGPPAARPTPRRVEHPVTVGLPYLAMMISFLMLVYVESSTGASPANMMTVVIFVLTSLVMLRQGVIFRDDAVLRERRAAGLVEQRYASLIKNASDVIIITDADGQLRFASPAAERTFGIHPDDLVGRNLLDLWTDADRERLAAFLAEVAATPGRVVGPIEVTVESDDRRNTLESVGNNLMEDPAIGGLALNFRDVSERKALEEQLRKLAFHDSLTLLANRSLFWNRVEHALALTHRTGEHVAVMFLDLDNFKNINDSLGHDAGDRLLQAAAQRLVKSTRPSDTVARLGGDEFAVLLEGITSEEDVERIATSITSAFNRPLLLDGREVDAAASIGVACSRPGDDTEQLLRNADIAMYNAKAAGKARFVMFKSQMQELLHDRLRLEQDIDRALARREFFIEFQPVVDLTNRELLGVEALVRWNHPERGLVMPGAFIPIAEESARIVELGRQVLVDACCQVQSWAHSMVAGEDLRVAVNISGRHLQQGNLVEDVRNALKISGLQPGNLVIELTESTIMHNTESNLERLRELKALGVRLAIDDFGMGYSSLSYLHRFPIDILKIDRAFVSRLTERDGGPELARAVVTLGATLGLETIAEGIENEDQAVQLKVLGCVAGQGFLFASSTSLAAVADTSFMARRAAMRGPRQVTTDLTATGRFRVDDIWARTAAG
ncbi:MAG TPA: EAL domain-containing protein [Steroidobacteraceae bacterium]|nr:EAL domain-containing protein [Steroidobacteraceae bacterium]